MSDTENDDSVLSLRGTRVATWDAALRVYVLRGLTLTAQVGRNYTLGEAAWLNSRQA